MSGATFREGETRLASRWEDLNEEVEVLGLQVSDLERRSDRLPALVRGIGRAFGFGPAGRLSWAHFKLRVKQEELGRLEADCEAQRLIMLTSGGPGETARQKMERMVRNNPAVLEGDIRLAYRPLVEAEESGGGQAPEGRGPSGADAGRLKLVTEEG
jgi:hypothetical protein